MTLYIELYHEVINSSNTKNIKPNQLDLFEKKTHPPQPPPLKILKNWPLLIGLTSF